MARRAVKTAEPVDTGREPLTRIPDLLGHEKVEAQLAEAVAHGHLPSAYLFTGLEGIGKASMALRLVAALLVPAAPPAEEAQGFDLFGEPLPTTQTSPHMLHYDAQAPALTRLLHGSHPDFLWIQPEYDAKKQTFKREMLIAQIRKISTFLSRTAGEGAWKVVVIDPADAMNDNAANALLKWLEEPPAHSLFILISHSAGGLLPTIRSRCRELAFAMPPREAFIHTIGEGQETLYSIVGGSLGLAQQWVRTDWQEHWQRLLAVLEAPERARPFQLMAVAEAASKDSVFGLSHWQRLIETLLLALTRLQQAGEMTLTDAVAARVIQHLAARAPLTHWLEVWDAQQAVFRDAERLYLDKRYVLMQVIGQMLAVERKTR
jgi:DNA polymerase III subunit delta'